MDIAGYGERMYSILTDGMGNIALYDELGDGIVTTNTPADDSDAAFVSAVKRMFTELQEGA